MQVTRIYESPRVTLPYTDEQWADVMALGAKVDRRAGRGDVRLTMGGEPTFVAVNDRDAPEWNTDALGPTKRGLATELVHKLRDEYGQGGFLHFGQGKWYPGEQLPRWALSICWRADGQPIWHNPSLFADEREPTHYTSEDAAASSTGLAERKLGLSNQFIEPGYEDTWYYLWRERRLPVNVDPFDSRWTTRWSASACAACSARNWTAWSAMCCRCKATRRWAPAWPAPVWTTGPWFFRDERMYLFPGDSPMGYRLPLDSLPWVSKADYPYLIEQDPYASRDALPQAADDAARSTVQHAQAPNDGRSVARPTATGGGFAEGGVVAKARATAAARASPAPSRPTRRRRDPALACPAQHRRHARTPAPGVGPLDHPHRAVRGGARPARANGPKAEAEHGGKSGVLYVFMPPLARLEDYLDLLAAVEATAAELGMKIVLEGYPPPRDPRLKLLQVTPDPGVIEVNIHPAHNWGELVQHTEFLYQAAFETRLSAEKFMTDGRHTGTGGGNHFVLGGATPSDSPFLRKPELLASLILYWHNHPSLSYLFSGMFIGPTSQAPRVDEARNDQLYELEIALREIYANRERFGTDMPPWLVDRTLRNILVDVTGNTHRSEFCIDKLYSPDSSTGRLGLLELRAFEMPPHARMSMAQQLLLRALVARFWKEPYRAPVTRWGTELHDRFLLPTFIQMDFDDVHGRDAPGGLCLRRRLVRPALRVPLPAGGRGQEHGHRAHAAQRPGALARDGRGRLVRRHVRYVDSSLERIEVRVTGLNESRYVITCNGRPLPLQSTGTTGEFVAGVRYKAWNPPSSLHPSIGVHAPLTFDIVDTWMKRSLGGCQYHVAHPGGRTTSPSRSTPTRPRAAGCPASSRMGHTPGLMSVPPASIDVPGSREFPFTLDLRRQL
jgi:uncharacterized protein (DUF2126 family)